MDTDKRFRNIQNKIVKGIQKKKYAVASDEIRNEFSHYFVNVV